MHLQERAHAGHTWKTRRLKPGAEIYTDRLGCLRRFADAEHAHTVPATEDGRAATEVQGAHWVDTVLSNVKRALDGAYHTLKRDRYA